MCQGNISRSLEVIVLIDQCTVMCGGEELEAKEPIGNARKSTFESYLELPNGIPSADTSCRVPGLLKPKGLSNQHECPAQNSYSLLNKSRNGKQIKKVMMPKA